MKKPLIYLILFIFLPGASIHAQTKESHSINEQVSQLVSKMTLEEKASLCSGRDPWSTKPVERLDIPWIWMADGPHGLRRAPSTGKW